jgi:hypothetical protein
MTFGRTTAATAALVFALISVSGCALAQGAPPAKKPIVTLSAKCGHSRMLKHIAELFAIEKDIRGRSPRSDVSFSFDNREAARRCIPEVDTHKAWSDQSEGQARRRHPLCAGRD